MNKERFLRDLGRALRRLRKEERRRQLEYFDEIIGDMMEGGMSEEEAVRKMGVPGELAENILEQMPKESFKKADVTGLLLSGASLVCATVVLIFFRMNRGVSFYMGGGDGPTSVFVAGRVGRPAALCAVTVLAAVATATAVYYVRKKRRH